MGKETRAERPPCRLTNEPARSTARPASLAGAQEARAAQSPSEASRAQRERGFWDDHVAPLHECLDEHAHGPNANVEAMLDALQPLAGKRVLDLACGTGVTTAWLAERGARVTGLELSPAATARAAEVCAALGLAVTFVSGTLEAWRPPAGSFDRIAGRYALHHLDCVSVAPMLAELLTEDGRAAFVETMDANPLLSLARRHLVGRFGIADLGTPDERPLTVEDLAALHRAFGELRIEVRRMMFFRVFDRQVLRWRSRRATRFLGRIDDALLGRLGLRRLSYHQVIVLSRAG